MSKRGGFLGSLLGKKKDDVEFATVREDEAIKKDKRGSEVHVDIAGTENEGDKKKGGNATEAAPGPAPAPAPTPAPAPAVASATPTPTKTPMTSRLGGMFSRLTGSASKQGKDKTPEPGKFEVHYLLRKQSNTKKSSQLKAKETRHSTRKTSLQ